MMTRFRGKNELDEYVPEFENEVNDTLYLNLFTTERCNLMCTYCIEKEFLGKDKFPSDGIENVLKFVEAQERKRCSFHFYGGESTMHPGLRKMVDEVLEHDAVKEVVISTNLIKPLDLPSEVVVFASLHMKMVDDPYAWMDRALEKADVIDIMVTPDTIDVAKELIEKRGDHRVYVAPIDSYRSSGEYDHHGFVERSVIDRSFCGLVCNAGFDVDVRGNVMKCSCQRRTLCNVLEDEPKKLQVLEHCRSQDCPGDLYFSRYSTHVLAGRLKR
jgi:sulfatase maturation enzyme AslB (radical SAM superfamily)